MSLLDRKFKVMWLILLCVSGTPMLFILHTWEVLLVLMVKRIGVAQFVWPLFNTA